MLNPIFYLLFLFLGSIYGTDRSEIPLPKICIVGGGLGGASAAHFLRRHFGERLPIHLLTEDAVGGRLADRSVARRRYEAGGSLVHARNRYMANFTSLLGLRRRAQSAAGLVGLYDGADMVFVTSQYTYVTMAKLLWNYGLSVVYLNDLVERSLTDFDNIYTHQGAGQAFTTPERLLGSMSAEFLRQLGEPTDTYLADREFDELFLQEFVASSLLANYGQPLAMQAFAGSVALGAIEPGMWRVHGGNKMVPDRLIEHSRVNVVESKVTEVTLLPDGRYTVTHEPAGGEGSSAVYDVVILASPLETSGVRIENLPQEIPAVGRKFHRTVATFVHGVVNASRFGFNAQSDLAKTILATNPDLFFNSISYQDAVDYGDQEEAPVDFTKDAVWKVFSKKPLLTEELDEIFSKRDEVTVMDWSAAYPAFTSQPYHEALPRFELHKNLYYVNAIEWAASAMETVVIAGRNAALLTINRWEGNLDRIDSSSIMAADSGRDEL